MASHGACCSQLKVSWGSSCCWGRREICCSQERDFGCQSRLGAGLMAPTPLWRPGMWSADQPGATCSAPKAISSLGRLSCSPVATLLRGDSTPCLLFYSAVGTKSSCQPSYRVLKALCCGFQDGLVSCNVFYAWCPRSHPTHCSSTSGLRGSLLACVGRKAECAVPVTSPFRLFCLHSPNLQKGHGPEFSTSVYCPNLQEMGESEPWPPQQRAVTVLRQS